jgi:hypothetical protein
LNKLYHFVTLVDVLINQKYKYMSQVRASAVLIFCFVLFEVIFAAEHDNNLDTPFIPRSSLYSVTLTTYFKIDFMETLNFIVDAGSNRFSVVQGAKPLYGSDDRFDVYFRKG